MQARHRDRDRNDRPAGEPAAKRRDDEGCSSDIMATLSCGVNFWGVPLAFERPAPVGLHPAAGSLDRTRRL